MSFFLLSKAVPKFLNIFLPLTHGSDRRDTLHNKIVFSKEIIPFLTFLLWRSLCSTNVEWHACLEINLARKHDTNNSCTLHDFLHPIFVVNHSHLYLCPGVGGYLAHSPENHLSWLLLFFHLFNFINWKLDIQRKLLIR